MHRLSAIALFLGLSTASLLQRDTTSTTSATSTTSGTTSSTSTTSSASKTHIPKACRKHPNSDNCIYDTVDPICWPEDSDGNFNLKAPCNIASYISNACAFGPNFNGNLSKFIPDDTPLQSNQTQRLCICESQYFNAMQGCIDCYGAHGAANQYYPPKYFSSLSSDYCAATATPSLGFGMFQVKFNSKPAVLSMFTSNLKATQSFSDPLAGSTAISLYYTPSVTGSAALNVGPFASSSPSPTTTLVKDGQIVATASTKISTVSSPTKAATKVATKAATTQSTSSTGGVGRQTDAALAGVLGLVGVVALL